MLGADYLLDALATEGLDHLFLVPGGLVDRFSLPALARQSALRPIVARRRVARLTWPMATPARAANFGAGSALAARPWQHGDAVAAAMTDGSPVLVISARSPRKWRGSGLSGREQPDARRRGGDEVDHWRIRAPSIIRKISV